MFFFLWIRRPPTFSRTAPLFPYPPLFQSAGAEHDPAAVVGQPEEVVGAQAGLDVLEGDVIDLLTVGEGVVEVAEHLGRGRTDVDLLEADPQGVGQPRSEEHTSELQSLMRISYAVFCLKKKKIQVCNT